ncbi:AAA family ATPase [bacterium]|nr:AAA family ATPase [bacterium]
MNISRTRSEGDSGIGKSSLVEEVHQPIVQKGACFVTCIFDRYQQHIPYGNLIKGFQRLVQQLLAESESNLTFWKERLTAALGANIRAIAEVIPEIELIFGELPAVEPAFREASLPPAEFQSRFNRIFLSFVRVFCQPRRDASHPSQASGIPQENRPLVLFLDNLQWADAATLKFLELMMRDPNTTSTFIIGTYRGQEVDPIHPLVPQEKRRAEGERERGVAIFSSTSSPNSPSSLRRGSGSVLVGLRQHVIINELHLVPLPLEPVTQLISDTLHQTVEQVKPLAELVLRKTNGNPFFVREFLKTLHAEGLLGFDEDSGSWTWDMPQIEAMDITENVVELMVVKLRKLPANTQAVLPLAACIGNAFNLDLLALIRGKSVEETFVELQEAIREELIVPTSDLEVTDLVCGEEEGETTGAEGTEQRHPLVDRSPLLILNYKFSHSRVQQAAYALIDDTRRRVVHLEIGRLVWNLEFGSRQFDPDSEQFQIVNLKSKISPEERAIEIVEHMNLGREFITDDAEKLQLAWLNLIAGRRTKDTSAYGTARKYLQIGINTLPSSSWETAYEVTFSLYKEMAEVEYLNGNFERAAALIWQTLERARSPLEKAELYNMLVVQYTMTANYAEAIQSGRRALALLGADLPETDPSNTQEGSMLEAILQVEIDRAESRLQGRAIADLLDEPVMRDRAQRTIVKVLANIASPVYISNQNLFLYIILKIVNISLTYGNAPESAYGYSSYGVILGSTSGRYHIGYEFGLLAIRLSEKFNQLAEKCKACFVSCHTLNHWVKHIRENDAIDREAYQAGLESGELLFAGYCLIQQLLNQYNQGKNLQQILSNIPKFVQFIQKTKTRLLPMLSWVPTAHLESVRTHQQQILLPQRCHQ